MAHPSLPNERMPDAVVEPDVRRVVKLFGGEETLPSHLNSLLDAHDLLQRGLPAVALTHLIEGLTTLRKPTSLEKAFGMSVRTIQRRKESPETPLSPEQSGRAWAFALILARAIEVFGSQAEAERWIEQPAIGLDQRRPIDLLDTPIGLETVRLYLERLDRGVYA